MTGKLHIVTDEEWWGDTKRKWLAQSVVVTGVLTDEFDRHEMLASFTAWLAPIEGPTDMTLTKSEVASQLGEMLTQPEVGLTWSEERQTFQGGRLI